MEELQAAGPPTLAHIGAMALRVDSIAVRSARTCQCPLDVFSQCPVFLFPFVPLTPFCRVCSGHRREHVRRDPREPRVTHQMGEGAFSTKIFDTESGECALKQVAAQGMGYLAVVMVMYTVVASLLEGMLPGPLEIGYHSSEPHVMAHNVIASLVLKLHEEKYIKFDDLASPAAEAAARKKADDMIEAYSSRPAVLEAHITEEWVASFFLKQRPGAYADDDGGDDSE